MIQFKIPFVEFKDQGLYNDYCKFIFSEINKSVRETANPLKYKVRQKRVLESSVIKWDYGEPPKTINLMYYVVNCLEMVKINKEFVIRVNDTNKIYGSSTKVSTLIRLLEYGNEKIKPYPVITKVLYFYISNYKSLLVKFIKERMKR